MNNRPLKAFWLGCFSVLFLFLSVAAFVTAEIGIGIILFAVFLLFVGLAAIMVVLHKNEKKQPSVNTSTSNASADSGTEATTPFSPHTKIAICSVAIFIILVINALLAGTPFQGFALIPTVPLLYILVKNARKLREYRKIASKFERVAKSTDFYDKKVVDQAIKDYTHFVVTWDSRVLNPPLEKFPTRFYVQNEYEHERIIFTLLLFHKYNLDTLMLDVWRSYNYYKHPDWDKAKMAVFSNIYQNATATAHNEMLAHMRILCMRGNSDLLFKLMYECTCRGTPCSESMSARKNPPSAPKEAIREQDCEESKDSEEFDCVKTCTNNISEIIQCANRACKSAYMLQSPEAKLDVAIYILHSWYRTLCTQSTPANAEKFSAWIVFKLHDYAEFQLHLDSEFAHDLITHRLDIYDSIMTSKLADKPAALSERLRQFVINDSEKEYFNEAPLFIPANTELRIENALTNLYLQVMRDTDPMFQQILDALTED